MRWLMKSEIHELREVKETKSCNGSESISRSITTSTTQKGWHYVIYLLLLSPQQALNHQPDRMFGLGLHMVVIIIYAERVGGGCCGGVMMDGKD